MAAVRSEASPIGFGKIRLAVSSGSPVACRERRQRLVSATLLIAIVVLAVGVPLPTQTIKTGTEPFPCQSCACSCHSAAHCWDKCCCHTDSEKLAWAARNGVQPPAFLVARVANASQLVSFADEPLSSSPSLHVRSVATKRPACCAHRTHATAIKSNEPGVGNQSTEGALVAVEVKNQSKANSGTRVLLWDAIAKCKGIELAVKLLSNTLVARGGQIACPEPLLLFVCPLLNERLLTRSLQVEPPIP